MLITSDCKCHAAVDAYVKSLLDMHLHLDASKTTITKIDGFNQNGQVAQVAVTYDDPAGRLVSSTGAVVNAYRGRKGVRDVLDLLGSNGQWLVSNITALSQGAAQP